MTVLPLLRILYPANIRTMSFSVMSNNRKEAWVFKSARIRVRYDMTACTRTGFTAALPALYDRHYNEHGMGLVTYVAACA